MRAQGNCRCLCLQEVRLREHQSQVPTGLECQAINLAPVLWVPIKEPSTVYKAG